MTDITSTNLHVTRERAWIFRRWFYRIAGGERVGPFDSAKEATYSAFMSHRVR